MCKSWNAKDFQEPPESGRGVWGGLSLRTSKRNQCCQHFHFILWTPNCERPISVVLNSPAGGTLCYGSSRKWRQPIISLSKSYLNLKSWVLRFSFLLSWCIQAVVAANSALPQKQVQPYIITDLHGGCHFPCASESLSRENRLIFLWFTVVKGAWHNRWSIITWWKNKKSRF